MLELSEQAVEGILQRLKLMEMWKGIYFYRGCLATPHPHYNQQKDQKMFTETLRNALAEGNSSIFKKHYFKKLDLVGMW